ncbi:MAG: hypothetical protein U0W24_10130 [Bacteroidales bacterium]
MEKGFRTVEEQGLDVKSGYETEKTVPIDYGVKYGYSFYFTPFKRQKD